MDGSTYLLHAAVAFLGCALGLRFRAPALILATACLAAAAGVAALSRSYGFADGGVFVVTLIVNLQLAFLAGASLRVAMRRFSRGGATVIRESSQAGVSKPEISTVPHDHA